MWVQNAIGGLCCSNKSSLKPKASPGKEKKKTELSSSGKYSTCMYLGMREQWGTEIDEYVFHLSVLSLSGVLSPLVLVMSYDLWWHFKLHPYLPMESAWPSWLETCHQQSKGNNVPARSVSPENHLRSENFPLWPLHASSPPHSCFSPIPYCRDFSLQIFPSNP